MSAYHPSMRDLYERLADAGLDRAFLRKVVLPPWWEDKMASVPASRELAELYLAHSLALDLDALSDPTAPLALPNAGARFKRSKRTGQEHLRPTAAVAQRIGEMLAQGLPHLPDFKEPKKHAVMAVRGWLFMHGYREVNLRTLLEYCWAHGIIVFHLGSGALPHKAHKIDGMAMFANEVPIIALGSNRQYSAWLLFHLAHELSHLLLRHVAIGTPPLVDLDLEASPESDPLEIEANQAALSILTEHEEPAVGIRSTAKLATLTLDAEALGKKYRVDPGAIALIWAQRNSQQEKGESYVTATTALKTMTASEVGSRAIINETLRSRLDFGQIPDASRRLLDVALFQ
jgi:Zn-dependent peptidase ImmA (M78 family)